MSRSSAWISRRGLVLGAVGLAAVPAEARAPSLDFVVIGDWGRRGRWHQREVAAQMGRSAAALGSRFVISVGDNFYEDGVASAADPQWQSSFEQIYTDPALQPTGVGEPDRVVEAFADIIPHSHGAPQPHRSGLPSAEAAV